MQEYLKLHYNLSSLLYKHLNSSYLDVDAIDFFPRICEHIMIKCIYN